MSFIVKLPFGRVSEIRSLLFHSPKQSTNKDVDNKGATLTKSDRKIDPGSSFRST